jgi:hypothetical protein
VSVRLYVHLLLNKRKQQTVAHHDFWYEPTLCLHDVQVLVMHVYLQCV